MAKTFLTPIDLAKNELRNAVIQNLSTPPSSPLLGQIYYDTDDNNLFLWDGSGWVDLTVQGGGISYGTPSAVINAGDAAVAGSSVNVLREDAQFAVSTAAAVAIDGTNAEGNSTSLARANHTHAYGANSITTAAFASSVRLDSINVPTTSVSLNSQKITSLLDGTAATDAVNLGQLQASAAGLDVKPSVRLATTAAVTLATGFENTDTIDGTALATGDRILVKDQAAPAENGIYTVNASGAPTRATDMDAWVEVPGAFVVVEIGTVNADTVWLSTANAGGTLNTTAITWTRWDVAAIGAGAGLTKTGNTLDVIATDTSLTVAADSVGVGLRTNPGLQIASGLGILLNGATLTLGATGLSVTASTFQPLDATLTALAAFNTNGSLHQTAADTFVGRTLIGTASRITVTNGDGVSGNPTIDINTSYVGQATITTLGTITTGTWNGTDIGTADGGTGSSTVGGARTNLKAGGYFNIVGSGSAATFVVNQATHGVGGADRLKVGFVTVVADGSQVEVDQSIDASGNVTFTFAASQTLSNYQFHILAA